MAIELRRLGHGFRDRAPLFGPVDLDLPGDRRLAILGAAGSGKTILLNILAGLVTPSTGTVARDRRLSFPAGYQRGFRTGASARANAGFAARIYGADPDEVCDFVARVTEFGALFDAPLRELAVAERQSFSYALAYAIPFDCYLFDTNVAAGTPAFRDRCLAMYEARSAGAGTILATRHARLAVQHCDCAVLIRGGGIAFFEDVAEAAAIAAREPAGALAEERP